MFSVKIEAQDQADGVALSCSLDNEKATGIEALHSLALHIAIIKEGLEDGADISKFVALALAFTPELKDTAKKIAMSVKGLKQN